ncbi:MAG: hypothetical protein JWM74_4768 [Myxococcaceae bacterium]|nr:hypothetical protein [Myxococcaceae bacterium]
MKLGRLSRATRSLGFIVVSGVASVLWLERPRPAPVHSTFETFAPPKTDRRAPRPEPPNDPAELARRVAELEKFTQLEAMGVGEDNRPSAGYQAFERVVAIAQREQLFALLAHPKPVVRAYVAGHVIDAMPVSDMHRVAPLLADRTALWTRGPGCGGKYTTVGEIVADDLGFSYPESKQLLSNAAHDPELGSAVRAVAFDGLRTEEPAAGWLAANDPLFVAKGVRNLANVTNALVPAELASHSDANVRASVAKALDDEKAPGALVLLARLVRDPNADVRAVAATAYAKRIDGDPVLVRALLTDPDVNVIEATEMGLVQRHHPSALALLEAPLLVARCDPSNAARPCASIEAMRFFGLGFRKDEVGAAGLATVKKLQAHAREEEVRIRAADWLADRGSSPF